MKLFVGILLFLFSCFSFYGQTSGSVAEKITLTLNITDFEDGKIETVVRFEEVKSHKIVEFKTNKEGSTVCLVDKGYKYIISILHSDDSYEYDIPDYADSKIAFTLKFHVESNVRAATKANALATIKVFNNPGINEVCISGEGSFKAFSPIKDDTAFIQLPVGKTYYISFPDYTIKNNSFNTDNAGSGLFYFVLYFTEPKKAELIRVKENEAVAFITYKNLSDQPVSNDTVIVTSKSTGRNYIIRTALNGSGLLILPKNDHYIISLNSFKNFATTELSGSTDALIANNITIKYPGTREIEHEKRKLERMIAERDSLYRLTEKKNELSIDSLFARLRAVVPVVTDEVKRNPDYFEKEKSVVCAVLNRNRERWKSKMIVTDVTGSMYPYIEQVTLWHSLEMMEKQSSQYIFFNDGDQTPDRMKIIGRTGGIYSVTNGDHASIIRTMNMAMRNGSGGDAPENNIEALLKAQEIKSTNSEVILVADALSPVKDIPILEALHVPVRVILCGSYLAICTDYLEIALKTGGSVHTIEDDIFELSKLHEGDTLKIGGLTYQFIRGKFFPFGMKM